MNQSQPQPESDYRLAGELDPDGIILRMNELEVSARDRNFKYAQFRTQLRNMHLAYMHAFTQSKYELSFYENGSLKSISPPKGWSE